MPKFTFDKSLPHNIPLLFKKRAKEYPEINLQAAKNKAFHSASSSYIFFASSNRVILVAISLFICW